MNRIEKPTLRKFNHFPPSYVCETFALALCLVQVRVQVLVLVLRTMYKIYSAFIKLLL